MAKVRLTIALACLLGLFCLPIPTVCAGPAPDSVHTISVAIGKAYPPLCFADSKGQPAGWLVDIWRLWSRKTGIKVKFVQVPFQKTLELVGNGKVDVHGGLFFSEERATYLDFVSPLAKDDMSIFFQKDIYGVKGVKDLGGFNVGAVKGDYAVSLLKKHSSRISLALFATNDELFKAAARGQLKVFVSDTPVGLYYLKKYGLLNTFNYRPGHPIYSDDLVAAVKKGNTALAAILKQGFSKISGREKAAIEDRWLGLGTDSDKDVVTIAADRDFPPFTWLTPSGRPAGILVDLWKLWSSKTGKRITFVFGNWEDTMHALDTGKAMVHSGLFKSAKRSEYMDFSLPLLPVEVNLFYPAKDGKPDLAKMSGKKIGILHGTAYVDLLTERFPGIRVMAYRNFEEMLPLLAKGELDGAVDIGISLASALRSMGLANEVAMYPEPLTVETIYGAMNKGHATLMDQIDQGLRRIPRTDIVNIEKHWVPDPNLRRYQKLIKELRLTPAEKDWLAKHKHIRLGVDPDWLPFEGIGPNGEYEGLSSSYAALLSKMLGVEMHPVKDLTWLQVLEAAQKKTVDVLPCLSESFRRSKYLSFTRPYLSFPNVLVTRQNHPMISGLADMKGHKVAVIRTFAVQEYIEKNHPNIDLVLVDNPTEGLSAVEDGTVTAYADYLHTVNYYIRKTGIKSLRVAATTKFTTQLSMGVRKDWPILWGILEKALQSLTPEQHAEIANNWFNVRFKERTDWGFIIKVGASAGAAVVIIIVVILLWNRRLAGEISQRRQVEAALRESQERFRSITANVPGVVYRRVMTPQGELQYPYISQGVKSLYDISPEQAKVHPEELLSVVHPAERERFHDSLKRSADQLSPWELEFRVKLADGTVKWVRGVSDVHREDNGDTVWDGLILDVTDRKLAEERFQTMAANVPGSLIQLRVISQSQWEYLFLSQKCVDFYGEPPEKVIREKIGLNWHSEDKARIWEALQAAFAAQREFNQVGRISINGELKWIRISASPSISQSGDLTYNGFILDITKRKLAEQEYLASERKVNAMSTAVNDALVMIDSKGKVLFWNPAAENLFGYSEEEAMGMNFHAMAAPDKYYESIDAGMERFAVTGKGDVLGTTTELTARNRQGQEFPVEVTLSSFQMDDQWFAVGVVRDITQRKRDEEEIKRSREDFRIIADYTYDWEGWYDDSGKLLWVNPAVERITGYSVEECMAMPDYPSRFVHPDDQDILKQSLSQAMAGKEGNDVPLRVRNKDGVEYWVALSWNPVFDDEGKFTGFRTSARDFTERKKAEDQLRFTQYTVDKAVQSIFWVNPETGVFKYVNQAACDSLGYSRDELLNMTVPQIDLDFPEQALQEFVATVRRLGTIQAEGRHQAKQGDILDVALSINLATYNEQDVIIVFAKDVTAQKRAERALKESEEKTRLILYSAGEGIFGMDTSGRVTFTNPTALTLLGYNEAELLGKPVHELIHHSHDDGSNYPIEKCPMQAAYTKGTAHKVDDEVLWRKDGSCFQVSYYSTPIKQNGEVKGAVVTFRDITERRKVEEEMRQYVDELERFNRLVVGREEKMILLKEEVNRLMGELGLDSRYEIVQ